MIGGLGFYNPFNKGYNGIPHIPEHQPKTPIKHQKGPGKIHMFLVPKNKPITRVHGLQHVSRIVFRVQV